jgi:hypothetical protein
VFRPGAGEIVKGIAMNIRKIAVVGGLAVGAALMCAPLATADDLTSIVDSEIASLNSLYEADASLAGVTADLTTPVDATGVLDTINPADITTVQGDGTTFFDGLVYGPFASFLDLDAAPGAQDLFNGALVEFDDALNVAAFFFTDNSGDLIPVADLLGSADQALDVAGSTTDAALFGSFLDTGIADLITAFSGGALG